MRNAALFLVALVSLQADVRLPALISDHMLLQRGVPARIWGWADPGESVTVRFRNQTVTAVTNGQGRWQSWLAPMEPAAAADLAVAGRNSITVLDVLVGEVWVASGQSNMAWQVARARDAEKEIAAANYPEIRLFKAEMKTAQEPREDVAGSWQVCSPESVKDFSAVGYFFARHLHNQLKVPFGVIQSAWGGTPAQSWTTIESLRGDPALAQILADWNRILSNFPEASERFNRQISESQKASANGSAPPRRPQPPMGPGHQHQPAVLYNAMIHPLTPYAIRGAIWYQGESNANATQAPVYQRLFETMIRDWRREWGQGDFPFLHVQLANFAKAGSPNDWVLVQEAQLKSLGLRHTGMAVINDIGDPGDIHPTNKQDVGTRLALWARYVAYGEKLVYTGPLFRQSTIEGAKMRVWFLGTGGGLKARGGDPLRGFELAGPDRRYYPAEAKIEGDTVVVWSPSVTEPVAVRYAWSPNPDANLFNGGDLPASLFRTDDWN